MVPAIVPSFWNCHVLDALIKSTVSAIFSLVTVKHDLVTDERELRQNTFRSETNRQPIGQFLVSTLVLFTPPN